MKLYTNGCSWVWGDELKDRENEAFPFLLQKKLNCQLIDDSECGSDNQRILRTTLKADLPIQSDCFVIIGWASIIRYEYYDRDSTTWVSNICSAVTEEYPPIHKYSIYKNKSQYNVESKVNLPNTEWASEHVLTLPIHPELKYEELEYIANIVNSCDY